MKIYFCLNFCVMKKNLLERSRLTPFYKKKQLQMSVKSLNNAMGKVYFQSAFIFGCLAHVLHGLTVIRTF